MSIEFITSIDDYNFPNLSDKMIAAIKENFVCNILYEKIQLFPKTQLVPVRLKCAIEEQNYWRLI